MPVKNAEPFLSDCLQSILAQTEQSWELIAINDHSTDESGHILEAFAKKDTRIKVYHNEGAGIIAALRLAFAKCTGQLISRMDADDLMMPEKLAALKHILIQKGKKHLATAGVEYFSAQGIGEGYRKYADWLNQLTEQHNNFQDIYKECVIPSPCWMLWREDLERCGAFKSERYPEDYDLCFRFYQAGLQVVGHPAVLHRWRDYPTRTSRTDEHYADNRFLDLKLHYFLKLDHQVKRPLVLWGAGKKGKLLAQQLIQHDAPFHWICNNKNKIGKSVYGQILKDIPAILDLEYPQTIVAVAGDTTQQEIAIFMQKHNWKKSKDWFLFC